MFVVLHPLDIIDTPRIIPLLQSLVSSIHSVTIYRSQLIQASSHQRKYYSFPEEDTTVSNGESENRQVSIDVC